MIELLKSILSGSRSSLSDLRDRRQLAKLYLPNADEHDVQRHISEAMAWLKRAQVSGEDKGVSYGVYFGKDFMRSYPETTGYIIQTFVEQAKREDDPALLQSAVEMGDWEIAIQLPSGAVMGGAYNENPTPAVFDTGMVLLGWSALIAETGEERFKQAAVRACDWLLCVQEPSGHWVRGNSDLADNKTTLYNVKAAWGLCEAGSVLGIERYVEAAVRNARYCVARQHENGWFPDCCLTDAEAPLLHTLAYTMQGLLGIGKITEDVELIAGARRLADALLSVMDTEGFLSGRFDQTMTGTVPWCCLTGSAQTSIVWSEFYLLTGEEKYAEAVLRVNRYLMEHHDIENDDSRLRGGLPGAWPVWGDYGKYRILNWATKFLVDALSMGERIKSHG